MTDLLRILFVEDLPSDAELAQRELKKEGIQCTALRVETKDDFLAALKEFRPDVIISDYSMPLFDGMRALKLSLEFDPLTPFILLTGSMNEEVAVNCMKAGATDYVIKEHISALPLVVKEALRQKQNRIEKEQVDESLRVRFAELEALHTLSSTLRTSQKLDQMLPLLLDQTLSVLETNSGAIWLYQAESADLRLAVARGWFSNIKGTAMVPGEGITGTVFLSGKAHLSVDFSEDPLVNHTKNPEVPAGWGGICVPIRTASEVVGVLFVSIQSPRQITPEQTRLLDSLAEMAGNTIHRMRLYEETIKRAEQLEAINLLGRALAETLDLPQMYAQVYKAANRLIPDTAAFFISLYHPDQQTITCEFGVVDKEEIDSRQLPIIPLAPAGKGLQSRVIHTAEALIVDDLMEKVDLTVSVIVGANKEKVTQTALYVPMLSRSKVVGVVQMQSYTPHRFKFADVSLLEMVANTAAAAIENARLLLETRQQVEHLQALHSINTSIAENMDLHVTLLKLLEHATQQLEVDAANILLLNPATHMLEFAAGRGFCTPRVQTARVRLGESMAGRAALEGRTIVADHVDAENSHFAELWSAEGFLFYSAAPLIVENQIKGVLEIYRRTPLHPDANWLAFLEMLAAQAAVALDNTQLLNGLQRANIDLSQAYDATIEGWSRALDLRDKETEGHTQRVTEMTLRLAHAFGIERDQMIHIQRGALLHDIGKMGVPDQILHKPGPLNAEEWVVMKKHPDLAYELLLPIAYLHPSLDIPYCHHEKWDGSGYPRGLSGEEIPLGARLFAIIDVWDALTSDRPYRAAWTRRASLDFIRSQSGIHFDPKVVEAFVQLIVPPDTPLS